MTRDPNERDRRPRAEDTRDAPEAGANELTHLDASGRAHMVDVSGKPETARRAVAAAELIVGEAIMARVRGGRVPKGNIYETARLAGIQAAKRTWELIPLCHMLPLDHVDVTFETTADRIRIRAEAATRAATGVEMEALTAVSVAGLTLYDMLKALGKTMRLESVRLLEKSGGRSGDYRAAEADAPGRRAIEADAPGRRAAEVDAKGTRTSGADAAGTSRPGADPGGDPRS